MTASIADFSLPAASLQYLWVPISESLTGGNPTGYTVTMAFPLPGAEPTVFYTGSWGTAGGLYYARCLIGPGGAVALSVGYYDVLVKIVASPEIPVLPSGLLEVT